MDLSNLDNQRDDARNTLYQVYQMVPRCYRSTISLKKSCHQPILSCRSFNQHTSIRWLCADGTIENEFTELLSPNESRSKM